MTQKLKRLILLATALIGSLDTASAGIDAGKAKMKGFVDSKEIAGAEALVANGDKTLHLAATGAAEIESKKPIATDSIFWIASMTKPIIAAAVMILQDKGKLSVGDPVSRFLPDFSDDKLGITIRQCLTHSSGLSEVTGAKTQDVTSLKELVPLFTTKSLVFPPGSKWKYCQTGINTAGRIGEVVSGKSFPEFLEERLFGTLGIKDTTFYLTEEQSARFATSYSSSGGGLKPAALRYLNGPPPTSRDRYPMANGGLFSATKDYAKFAQMILNGGKYVGYQYLKEESVKQMTTVQSGDLATGFTLGNARGLGWRVVREPQGVTAALSAGSFGHGGAYGKQAWIDPVKARLYVLMIQRADIGNGDASEIRRGFQIAAAQP